MKAAVLAAVAFCAGVQATYLDTIHNIPIVDCDTSNPLVELAIQEVSGVEFDGAGTMTTRLYSMKDADGTWVPQFPAPTIRMRAGETCYVSVENHLSTSAGRNDECPSHHNEYHCPDTSVLHTHGLHVSPKQDKIDSVVNTESSYNYVYEMPADHMAGTHWWHAHYHGSTTIQVMGGMAGALLVENDSPAYEKPAELAALYNADEVYLMTLFHVFLTGTVSGLDNYLDVVNQFGTWKTIDPGFTQTGDKLDHYIVNGVSEPTIKLVANVPGLLRFVHAGVAKSLALVIPTGCTAYLIARDGVAQYMPYPLLTSVVFFPGNRADVEIMCTSAGMYTVGAEEVAGASAVGGNQHVQATVFNIEVSDEVRDASPQHPPTDQAVFPPYMPDYRTLAAGEYKTTSEDGVNSINVSLGPAAVNGVPFPGFGAGSYVAEYCMDEVYEFTLGPLAGGGGGGGGPGAPPPPARLLKENGARHLQGGGTSHPAHIHINHHQVQSFDASNDVGIIREGEWRDVTPFDSVVVRLGMYDFDGEYVMHCHLTEHEDTGMMALLKVDTCGKTAPVVKESGSADAVPPTDTGSSSSGADSSTGGADSSTGGADSSTGGADSSTGGADSSTGGADSSTGGADSSTGGADSSTGGADSSTGGGDSGRGDSGPGDDDCSAVIPSISYHSALGFIADMCHSSWTGMGATCLEVDIGGVTMYKVPFEVSRNLVARPDCAMTGAPPMPPPSGPGPL